MKRSNSFLLLAAAALTGLAACGAPEGEIEISTSGDSTGTDTVVEREVIVDTVTRPADTVVHLHTDTVVVDTRPRTDTVRAPITVTASERRLIDLWLAARRDSINEFGDPAGTVYAGGTPLFNEATGERIDRYEYIMRRHPDRPWRSTR